MALEGFYNIDEIRTTESGYQIDVTLFAGHKVYEGHFPGQPVVPGVCTLTVIRESVSHAAGREMMFSSIKECKFLSALIPTEDLKLNLDITLAPDGQLKCNVIHNEAVAMKVSAAMTDIKI